MKEGHAHTKVWLAVGAALLVIIPVGILQMKINIQRVRSIETTQPFTKEWQKTREEFREVLRSSPPEVQPQPSPPPPPLQAPAKKEELNPEAIKNLAEQLKQPQ